MEPIVTKYTDICFYCGKPAECQHHLIFGRGLRELADEDGLIIPSCNKHHNMGANTEKIHNNPMAEKLSKMLGQAIWEKHYGSREDFMKRYGQSYL